MGERMNEEKGNRIKTASASPHAVFAELVFWVIVRGLRPQKYEGGKSASGAH